MECTAVADPELRFSPNGMAVAKIRTASNKAKKNDDGTWAKDENNRTVYDKVCYLTVTCFDKLAEHVAESVVKGDRLVITGQIQTEEWNDRDTGEKRSMITCTAWTVAVSLAFRTVRHGEGRAERQTAAATSGGGGGNDPWATPSSSQSDEPPF